MLNKALFAWISGFSELFFVSPAAHQLLYRTLTGYDAVDCMISLGIHLGCLIALLFGCQKRIKQLQTEKRLASRAKRRRSRQPDIAALMDIRIIYTASITIILGFLLYPKAQSLNIGLFWMSVALAVNGMVLFLPRLLSTGNKNGRSFTPLDGTLMGIVGFLGMIPGFSRIGCVYSAGTARGAGKSYALDLGFLLSIPAIVALLCFDVYTCLVSGGFTGIRFLGFLIATLMSFVGAYIAIILMRLICSRTTTVGFAYYSWGLAIFVLLIYLFVS